MLPNHARQQREPKSARLAAAAARLGKAEREPYELPYQALTDPARVPRAVDWRGSGADGVVKDQANCGSCWVGGWVGRGPGCRRPGGPRGRAGMLRAGWVGWPRGRVGVCLLPGPLCCPIPELCSARQRQGPSSLSPAACWVRCRRLAPRAPWRQLGLWPLASRWPCLSSSSW